MLATLGLLHVAAGAAIGRWWAPFLPALVVVCVIPADRDREIATWFDYLFFAFVPAAILLAVGVLIRRARSTR